MSIPRIHIIIPHWGEESFLSETLQSLMKQDYPDISINVVDNNPDNRIDSKFKEQYRNITFWESPANSGCAGSYNLVIKKLNIQLEEILLFSDNDICLTEKSLLTELVSSFFADPHKPCIVSPAIYHFSEPEKIHNAGWILFEKSKIVFNSHRTKFSESNSANAVDYLSGCFMMFPYSVIKKVGYPDDSFFMYAEDADFCYRAWKNDIPVFSAKNKKVLHHISRNASLNSPFREYYISRNIYLFLEKHKDHPQYNYFFLLQMKKDRKRVLGLFFRGVEWKLRSAVLDGIRDGRKGVKGLTRKP